MEAELAATLQQQELVDRSNKHFGSGVRDELAALVRTERRGIAPIQSLPDSIAETLLQLGLRDDVAVHFHQDLFDDFCANGRGEERNEANEQRRREDLFHVSHSN